MKTFLIALTSVLGLFSTACATSFTGSAHIEGGRESCERMCAGEGLQMSGMVYMGEYSSACVCQVPGQASGDTASASAGAAAVGVMMQMRRQEEENDDNDIMAVSMMGH